MNKLLPYVKLVMIEKFAYFAVIVDYERPWKRAAIIFSFAITWIIATPSIRSFFGIITVIINMW